MISNLYLYLNHLAAVGEELTVERWPNDLVRIRARVRVRARGRARVRVRVRVRVRSVGPRTLMSEWRF